MEVENCDSKRIMSRSVGSEVADQVSFLTQSTASQPEKEADNSSGKYFYDYNDAMITTPFFETANGNVSHKRNYRNSPVVVMVLIILLGIGTSVAFLMIGISGARSQQEGEFERNAVDTSNRIINAFEGFIQAAAWIHYRCRKRDFTHEDFREIYENLISTGLQFQAMDFMPRVLHSERETLELEAKLYYAENYPHVDYRGITGFNTLDATRTEKRINQSFYYPVHYIEPVIGNEAAIDLDLHSSESRMRAVQTLLETGKPALTDRLSLVQNAEHCSRCGPHPNGTSFAVKLNHPGYKVSTMHPNEPWPNDMSGLLLCIPDLLIKATEKQSKSSKVYIHDLSHPNEGDKGVFMGGAHVERNENPKQNITLLEEISLEELRAHAANRRNRLSLERTIQVANRLWTVTVVADEQAYRSNSIPFIIFGGFVIFASSVALALWMLQSSRRLAVFNELKAAAKAEKSALILENAKKATDAERELNDFMAHEVRNPVAAALTACSFIKMAFAKDNQFRDAETRKVALDDVNIIDHSLNFVNDLLRNMLDMHRASANQLHIDKVPTDLLHDVLEPVSAMLHQRGSSKVTTIVACEPRDLLVLTDKIRLKQLMINLGRNSYKFVDRGFIRLSAGVHKEKGHVVLYVEDSGSGIPEAKRNDLFTKYQASLDLLSQGTGIGLFLCKTIVDLMGGEIYLDDSYDSGIPGHPGTRFVIDLKVKPIEYSVECTTIESSIDDSIDESHETECFDADSESQNTSRKSFCNRSLSKLPSWLRELPEKFSVLFVDDDPLLRKLFMRSIKGLCPGWTVQQAASGEAALQLIDADDMTSFDLIFVDMYMANVEKQLLGTEAVAIMRQKGVTSVICGLSANDREEEFIAAGANAFISKPFPCEHNSLRALLLSILPSIS